MSGSRGAKNDNGGRSPASPVTESPRVVIFEGEEPPIVEVVELPGKTSIGTRICHRGTSWLVTGLRTHNRVVICSPAEA